MKVLAIIPARAGSKRLPGKNKMTIGRISLWRRAVETAVLAGLSPVVATDDEDIIREIDAGAGLVGRVILPGYVTDDTISMWDVVEWTRDAAEKLNETRYEATILLHPTSPLRTAFDVTECLRIFERSGCDYVVSVTAKVYAQDRYYRSRHPYERNGAVYVARRGCRGTGWTQFYVMPPERSVDIDTMADLEEARLLAGS